MKKLKQTYPSNHGLINIKESWTNFKMADNTYGNPKALKKTLLIDILYLRTTSCFCPPISSGFNGLSSVVSLFFSFLIFTGTIGLLIFYKCTYIYIKV